MTEEPGTPPSPDPDRQRVIVRDAVGLLGLALIVLGVALIFVPAGIILAGALLAAAAVLDARNA